MAMELGTPDVDRLGAVVAALRDWQDEARPTQVHPGDVGWFWQHGPDRVAAALRTWTLDGQLLAIGFLDGPDVLRMTVAPDRWDDGELADQILADVSGADRGVLPAGKASVESPNGSRMQRRLSAAGWSAAEPWSPLRHDFSGSLDHPGLRVEVVGPDQVTDFTAVHRSAWGSPRFTTQLWQAMAAGLPFADARCLLGYDDQGVPVAGATVWSAGPGKPGLLEPVGVHADHRGHGHGRLVSVAAAAELQKMGASSAEVCTLSSLTSAVATYRSAGFIPLPERLDRTRNA